MLCIQLHCKIHRPFYETKQAQYTIFESLGYLRLFFSSCFMQFAFFFRLPRALEHDQIHIYAEQVVPRHFSPQMKSKKEKKTTIDFSFNLLSAILHNGSFFFLASLHLSSLWEEKLILSQYFQKLNCCWTLNVRCQTRRRWVNQVALKMDVVISLKMHKNMLYAWI